MAIVERLLRRLRRPMLGLRSKSPEIAANFLSATDGFKSLVLMFLRSTRFPAKRDAALLPPDRAALDIELAATGDQSARMVERIRDAWTGMGSVRPHYSVLTEDEFHPDAIDSDAVRRFWDSGRREVEIVGSVLASHGVADAADKIAVEYGSGIGRVTIPLAARFRVVHAYDISPSHLAQAQRRAAEMAADNIIFHGCGPGLPEAVGPCDFFYSRLVFQHNPPPIIRALIRLALRSLRPGGIAIFQVPTYMAGYQFRVDEYLAAGPRMTAEMHCIPQAEIFAIIAEEGCGVLEVREDGSIGRLDSWLSNIFVVRRPAGDVAGDSA